MNDIDTLMSRISTINSKPPTDITPSDIDDLVLFYRHRRTRKASLTQSHDSASLDTIMPKPTVEVHPAAVRRFKKV